MQAFRLVPGCQTCMCKRGIRNYYNKVSATKLGPLSTQLPFTGTLSVIPFSKRTEKTKNTVLIRIIVGF